MSFFKGKNDKTGRKKILEQQRVSNSSMTDRRTWLEELGVIEVVVEGVVEGTPVYEKIVFKNPT